MINLDNSVLGISGVNAAAIVAASTVTLSVSYDGEEDAPKRYVDGADSAVVLRSFQFDDYNADLNTVRLYCIMSQGLESSWGVKHTFTIRLVIGNDVYEGTVVFVGNAYQAA